MSTIVFSHVFFSYGTLPVLTNVSFTCGPTDRLVVVGPNGIGKSTLLALAAGQLQPDSGTITGPALSATQLVPLIGPRPRGQNRESLWRLVLRSRETGSPTPSHSSSMPPRRTPASWRRASTSSPSTSPGTPLRATKRSTTVS
nr:ATP-binding cassette domain-containing protein [Actinomyces sp. ICM58]